MINRMTIQIGLDIDHNEWKPGLSLINDPKYEMNELSRDDKYKILNDFSKYLAKQLSKLLQKRIKTQYRYLRWKPLSPGYKKLKERLGLSTNIWEATGLLVKSIKSYKQGNSYIVGIDPNLKYPNSDVKVLFVAECMEFGTINMPARPLFGPTTAFMRRHIRRYWESYLNTLK